MTEPQETRATGNDLLSRHGALALFLTGIALIVLAARFSARDAVAPIFAFTGFAAVVLAAFLHRLRGDVEVSLNRIKLVLSEAKDAVGSGPLTPEQLSNLYERILEAIGLIAAGKTPPALPPVEVVPAQEPVPPPTPAPAPSEVEGPAAKPGRVAPPVGEPLRGWALERRVAEWLEQNGWETEVQAPGMRAQWDFVATRGDEKVMVEVRSRRRFGAADIAAVAVLLDHFQLDVPHAVLVVDGTLSPFAVEQADAAKDVMTVYVRDDDGFRVATGQDVIQRPARGR
jgi:hypothetical protein